MKDKLIIELNKALNVQHQATTCESQVISRAGSIFKSSTCFLNFHGDRLEFELKVGREDWNNLRIVKKVIAYEKYHKSWTVERIHREFKILCDDFREDSKHTTLRVHGDFKDVLLGLFSPHKKEFKLTIEYTKDEMNFEAVFVVLIPNIDPLKNWNSSDSFTGIFMPEDLEDGVLLQLFKKEFRLTIDSSQEEKELQCRLLEYTEASTEEKFTSFNFLEFFQRMLAIEDCFSLKEMEDFSLTFQKVTRFQSIRLTLRNEIEKHMKYLMCEGKMKDFLNKMFIIEATKMMPPETQEFDYVYLTDMQDYQQFHDDLQEIADQRVTGKILYIFGNLILFQPVMKKQQRSRKRTGGVNLDDERPYHVEFVPNRIAVRVAHRAVEDAINNRLMNYLQDFTLLPQMEVKEKKVYTKFRWMNPSIRGNMEQRVAIRNIVNCTSFPSPYVIFGPPGTGKSTTVIEAIAQIVKLKPHAHILVTASSNSACDDLGNRLIKYVSLNKILRIYSPSFDKKPDKIDKNLELISNFRYRRICKCNKRSCPENETCCDPSYEEFYTSRVVIATLVSCGRIVSAGIKWNHFDYIFIDEAASDCEPYALIPIAGLGSSKLGVHAQIVFSGDHKQLGAIVRDDFCRKLGLEKSMMERLMEMDEKYQRDSSYDENYVTQLVQNYRSHAAILQFSNENFYHSQLVPKCPPEIANFAIGWYALINKNFPVLFYSTHSPSTQMGTSLINTGEINQMDVYIRDLLTHGINGNEVKQSDIGVISPYRAQRDRITEQFKAEFPEIEIGTVDSFQGREMKIIILSTVRSQTPHVGFLRNEKRLNVALTRAKSLLIIIGNAATLQKCFIWNKFVAYCFENRAITGDFRLVDLNLIKDENFTGNEEKPDEVEDEYEG